MSEETAKVPGQDASVSRMGEVMDDLGERIHGAWMLSNDYPTRKLLTGTTDDLFKKVIEDAVALAFVGKDFDAAHRANAANAFMEKVPATMAARSQGKEARAEYLLCDDAANLIFTLMVVLERFGISRNDLAAAIDARIAAEGLPSGDLLAPGQKISK